MLNHKMMVAVAILGASVASLGCVSKGLLRQTTEKLDARVDSTESAVEANERRIEDMARETDGKIAAVESSANRALDDLRHGRFEGAAVLVNHG